MVEAGARPTFSSIGASQARAVAMLTYTQGEQLPDADRDGRVDTDDRCPNEPEDMDGFKDDDGCPDPSTKVQFIVATPDGSPIAKANLKINDQLVKNQREELHEGAHSVGLVWGSHS